MGKERKMERMQTAGRLRGLGGEIYEALPWRSFQEEGKKERKKKKNNSLRWLEICLAGDGRDVPLPVCTEEGLISPGWCRGLGKVPFAAEGG